jgi:nucleoside-diphosphate-sugar epimerase
MRKHLAEISYAIKELPVSKTIGQLPHSHLLDVTLAREELEFAPALDLDSGIAAIVKWVESEKRRLI